MGSLYQEGWRSAPGCVDRAFSLLEVLVAVALFAASVTVILALLPGLTRQATDATDRLAAQRLPEAVRLELTRVSATGLDSLAARIPVMGGAALEGFVLVATRRGDCVESRDYLPPEPALIAAEDRYFLIECWRFPDGPLRYETDPRALALWVRVSWPYPDPASPASATSPDFIFVSSLNR